MYSCVKNDHSNDYFKPSYNRMKEPKIIKLLLSRNCLVFPELVGKL